MDSVGRKAEFGLSRFFKAAVFVFCCMALLLIGTCSAFAAPPNKNADTAKTQAQKKKEAKIDKELEAKRKAVMQTVQADIKKNAYDKASIHLEDALARDPKWKEGLKLLGNIYVSHFKHYKNAAETYRTYLYYYPNDEKIKREYGRCLISSNDFEAAEEVWKSIFQKDANDAEAVYNLAEIAYSQNSLKDAMHMADDACMLKDDYYEAMYLQLKIYVRLGNFSEADKKLKYLQSVLPEDSPILSDSEALAETIKAGIIKGWVIIGGCILMTIGVICAAVYIKHASTKVRIRPAPKDMDTLSEDSICRYVLGHIMNLTQLPRALCWIVPLDNNHISLVLSELISDPSIFALRTLNQDSVHDFIESFGRNPFYYKDACKDSLFEETLPGLVHDLSNIELNIGVPIVWEDQLLAVILLGRSRNSNRDEDKAIFEKNKDRIMTIAMEGASALETLRKKRKKNYDLRTGLWNRDYFEAQVGDMCRGCAVLDRTLCTYMMTVDQTKQILENNDEKTCSEFLFNVGSYLKESISKEEMLVLCHLDNGVFGLVAPERTAEEGERLAKTLQSFLCMAEIPGSSEKATGLVAWAMFPDDSKDPKMLRAILSRAFRDARMSGGNKIIRAQKVEDSAKESAVKVAEKPDDVVVTRRAVNKSSAPSAAAAPIVAAALEKSKESDTPIIRRNIPNAASAPKAQVSLSAPIKRNAVSVNLSGLSADGSRTNAGSAKPIERPPVRGGLSMGPSRLSIPKKEESPDFKVDINLDEEGIDAVTQFCGEEVFKNLIESEMEADDNFSMLYFKFANLKSLRTKGKTAYMKVRRESAEIIQAFLSDSDIPGIIGEDDFAVLCIGSDESKAKSAADRICAAFKSSNLGTMVCGISSAAAGDSKSSKELLKLAESSASAQTAG